MNKQEFIQFTIENFNIDRNFLWLLENVLTYAETITNKNEQYLFLENILSGTIGYTQDEIKRITL